MTTLHGFRLLRERDLPEASSTCAAVPPCPYGAELLSLINDDENKVFGANSARRRRTRPASLIS